MPEELKTVNGLWLEGAKTFVTCVCICVYLQYGTGTEMNGSRIIGMLKVIPMALCRGSQFDVYIVRMHAAVWTL